MNTRTKKDSASIPVDQNFTRLLKGETTIDDLASERAAARANKLAKEDDYMRRRRLRDEFADPYAGGYCQ